MGRIPVVFFFISPKGGPTVYCMYMHRDHNGNNGVNEQQKMGAKMRERGMIKKEKHHRITSYIS